MARQSSQSPATRFLDRHQVNYRIHEYHHEPGQRHFADEAVAALGHDPRRTFKTLIVRLTGGKQEYACAVVPVSRQLDLKALAHIAGSKRAVMADPDVAERLTGMVVGGISPVGQKRPIPQFIDESALTFPTIFVSGGQRGLQVEIAPEVLIELAKANPADLTRVS